MYKNSVNKIRAVLAYESLMDEIRKITATESTFLVLCCLVVIVVGYVLFKKKKKKNEKKTLANQIVLNSL